VKTIAAGVPTAEEAFSKPFNLTYCVEMADGSDGIFDEAVRWVRENWDPDMTVAQWWERVFEASYSLPSLPLNAYGRGYSRAEEQAVWRGFAEVGALGPPGGIATMMAAPTIAQHASDTQIERFVPPILLGLQAWCQLFSEPGAGSDLAGLTTKAVRDGDEWVITGQKVWTSFAHEADLGMLLARTDPDAPKHAGITWFAFEMLQPAVEVRPLREMNGRSMFNESSSTREP
jgi:alkylation response protein AidB-like acyl-CoA dehydrogenase